MSADDPYHDRKVYHKADLINKRTGAVSALCFAKPRSINLEVAAWTIRDEAVTCPKCLEMLNAGKPAEGALVPVCKLCKRPMVRSSVSFWACPRPDLCKRPLIPAYMVDDAIKAEEKQRAKHVAKERRADPFEV